MVTFDELKRRFIHLNNKDLLLAFDNTEQGMARDACATIILDRVNRYSTVDTLRVIVERDALRAELEKVHSLLRAWRTSVTVVGCTQGVGYVKGRNDIDERTLDLIFYVDSLEDTK